MRTPFSLSLLWLASSGLVGCAGGGARDSGLLDQDYDGYTVADGDCDDGNRAINPLATDVVGDGYSTCDGDCDDSDASLELADSDRDGCTTC